MLDFDSPAKVVAISQFWNSSRRQYLQTTTEKTSLILSFLFCFYFMCMCSDYRFFCTMRLGPITLLVTRAQDRMDYRIRLVYIVYMCVVYS